VPYKRGLIAAAIRAEMRRGGQIYFVHNRVETLHTIAARVQELVPSRAWRWRTARWATPSSKR